jgi:hypothetical protein
MAENSKRIEGRPSDSDNALTVRDLIRALGWQSNAKRNEFDNYWNLRFELLGRALGLPTDWSEDHAKASQMLSCCFRLRVRDETAKTTAPRTLT